MKNNFVDNETIPELIPLRGKFLEELENLFGPRDRNFDLGEIIFKKEGFPMTYKPDRNANIVDIHLTNKDLLEWQLAHECVHLLDPYFPPPTNFLEEGIATWFQTEKREDHSSDRLYIQAEKLVSPLMENGYLPNRLKSIRKNNCRIGEITKEILRQEAPEIDDKTAEELTKKFPIPKPPHKVTLGCL